MSRILYSSSIIPWSWEKQMKPLLSSTSSSVLPSHSSFLEVSLLTPKRQKQNQKSLNFNAKSFQTLKFLSLRNRPNFVQKKSQDEVGRKQNLLGNAKNRKKETTLAPRELPGWWTNGHMNKHMQSSVVVLTCWTKCRGITKEAAANSTQKARNPSGTSQEIKGRMVEDGWMMDG